MKVRRASAGDLDAVRQLLRETWHATYDATMGVEAVDDITSRWHCEENLKRQMNDPQGCFLVAENADGTIVGHAGAAIRSDDVKSLSRLYVLPEQQRSGAGAALLAAVIEWAGRGAAIELEVETANTAAISFYRKHGFASDGKQVQCGGDPVAGPAIVMKRYVS